jgi:hypothetical protein
MTAPASPTIFVNVIETVAYVRWQPVAAATSYKLYADPTTVPTTVKATVLAAAMGADGWFSSNFAGAGRTYIMLGALTGAEESEPSAETVVVLAAAPAAKTVAVAQPFVVVSATPLLDTSAYASGDTLHVTTMKFAECFNDSRSGYIEKMVIVDDALQSAACELWLFKAPITAAAANAAHSISDPDALNCVGVISSGAYYASALNSVSVAKGINLPVVVDIAPTVADWAADTPALLNAAVEPTGADTGYFYVCSARAGDFKTHATTQPVWPKLVGATIVDDQVTWTCHKKGHDLFGLLVTRGAPTYAAGSLTVTLVISRN